MTFGGNSFNFFPENQLTKFIAVPIKFQWRNVRYPPLGWTPLTHALTNWTWSYRLYPAKTGSLPVPPSPRTPPRSRPFGHQSDPPTFVCGSTPMKIGIFGKSRNINVVACARILLQHACISAYPVHGVQWHSHCIPESVDLWNFEWSLRINVKNINIRNA